MLCRALLIALLLAGGFLSGAFPRSIAAEEITAEQRKAIEGIIHDYLMKNPDVLIDALREAEAKANSDADVKAAQVLRDRRHEVFDDPAPPVGGNPQGGVTIVSISDSSCPERRQWHIAIPTMR